MVKENKEQTKIVIVFKECIKMVKKDTVLWNGGKIIIINTFIKDH
jgi:hypothetical protein